MGHNPVFEIYKARVCAAMYLAEMRKANSQFVYSMICACMTPEQKLIVRKKSKLDIKKYNAILSWFTQCPGHEGYKMFSPPRECPTPVFIQDPETENNTDNSMNSKVESRYTGGMFDFSLAQDPSVKMLVYETEDNFTANMIGQSPTREAWEVNSRWHSLLPLPP